MYKEYYNKKHPKFFRALFGTLFKMTGWKKVQKMFDSLLKKTEHDKRIPTDEKLDAAIEHLEFYMQYIWPLINLIIKEKIVIFFKYKLKILFLKLLIFCVFLAVCFGGYEVYALYLKKNKVVYVEQEKKDVCLEYKSDSTMNLRNYLMQIAYMESQYSKVARRDGSQFWGLYQIGEDARKSAGYADMPMNVFLAHPEIQDLCMIELLKYDKKYMQSYIDKYCGNIVDGILVTESGLLALCQLGCGAARGYLDSGRIPNKDENNNSPRLLLKLGGYKLNLNDVKYSIQDAVHK